MRFVFLIAATSLSVLPMQAGADSFSLTDFSAADFGRANAGRVTFTDDAGIAFGNPAMMALFSQKVVTFQATFMDPQGNFADNGSVDVSKAALRVGADDVIRSALIPSFYAVWPVSDRFAVGFSVNTPFGLSTDYTSDWAGRYQALESELKTINLNPSISYKLSDTFFVGGGVSVQYAQASLSNAIDYGAACLGALNLTTCTTLGLLPQGADGLVEVEADDVSFGYNAGIGWAPHSDWRFGFHYRSEVDHELEGDATFSVPKAAVPLTAKGAFTDSDATALLALPATAEVGARWQVNERASLYATAQWMDWSQLADITVKFDNAAQPASVEALNYDDAYRYGVGGDVEMSDSLTLRAGIAIDTIPTDGRPLPSARIPDGQRTTYAFGATWEYSDAVNVNVSYSHIAFEDAKIDRVGTFGERLVGDFDVNVPVISANISWNF